MTQGCRRALAPLGLAALLLGCSDATGTGGGGGGGDEDLALSGGAMTVFDATSGAFETPAPNLSDESLARHLAGDVQFGAIFVTAPAPVNPGLGPVFNNTSCEGCHVGDGRGQPPPPGQPFGSMLFRTSVGGMDPNGGPLAAPGIGLQLQLRAIVGFAPEGSAQIDYEDVPGVFSDGTPYTLRRPIYTLEGGATPLPGALLVSPRVAPPVFGLGLLEALSESSIMAAADPDDRDGDGVSGRPNRVWDPTTGASVLGRFGWKANAGSLLQQTAAAYNGDMGVTSSFFPAEPCEGELPGCDRHAPDVSDDVVHLAQHYIRTLGVPARRGLDDPVARQGEEIFRDIGCATCHLPDLRTGTLADVPEASNQVIHPYTDLLLHDMGAGLADDRPDFEASGREWRTAPLWGIGLTMVVNGHSNFLHDGRARDLMEAVLWHDGEAAGAKERVLHLSAPDREALLAFLRSL
jgi:CxxC motif-containing protein (DUF1111 family)